MKLLYLNMNRLKIMSLPSRERGLKFLSFSLLSLLPHVAPFAGAWIEIDKEEEKEEDKESLPSRERGLK